MLGYLSFMQKNNRLSRVVFFSFSLVLFSVGVSAQDNGSPSFEAYDRPNYEPVYLSGGGIGGGDEDSVQNRAKAKNDSLAFLKNLRQPSYKRPSVSPKDPPKSPPAEPDNSLLSFNFLYYLIQKYKMQDIVD